MSPGIVVAVIGGLFGFAGAVTTAILAQRQSRKLAEFEESRAERNARREYEYEALKRLYEIYEPLRFCFVDAAGSALRRISEISRSAQPTSINPSRGRYDVKATVYQLLAPIALVRLMDQRLTLVDLRLSPEISTEYAIAKAIARALSDDDLVASWEPVLIYTPYVDGWREKREECPQRYRRQGLPPGRLENAAEALLLRTATGEGELVSFGQFEAEFNKLDPTDVNSSMGAARDLFTDFDPTTRHVLWRLLVSQVLLYGCYLDVALGGADAPGTIESLADRMARSLEHAVHNDLRLDLYWDTREKSGHALENQAYESTIPIACRYYDWRVSPAVGPLPRR